VFCGGSQDGEERRKASRCETRTGLRGGLVPFISTTFCSFGYSAHSTAPSPAGRCAGSTWPPRARGVEGREVCVLTLLYRLCLPCPMMRISPPSLKGRALRLHTLANGERPHGHVWRHGCWTAARRTATAQTNGSRAREYLHRPPRSWSSRAAAQQHSSSEAQQHRSSSSSSSSSMREKRRDALGFKARPPAALLGDHVSSRR
jgi:hypothetical protein